MKPSRFILNLPKPINSTLTPFGQRFNDLKALPLKCYKFDIDEILCVMDVRTEHVCCVCKRKKINRKMVYLGYSVSISNEME